MTCFFSQHFFKAFISLFLIFGMIFSFSAGVAGAVSFVRIVDGGLGLLDTPLNQSQKEYKDNLSKAILNGEVEVEAVELVSLSALIAALTDVFIRFIMSVVDQLVRALTDFITRQIMPFINKILSKIDEIINIIEQLTKLLSSTRVAVGFLTYQTLQNDANILSSKDFAEQIIKQTNERIANFQQSIGKNGENTIIDAVTWLDFMTVQKELQVDTTLQNVIENILKIDLNYYDNVRNQLMLVLSGASCDNTPILNALSVFRPILGNNTDCLKEVDSRMGYILSQRENQIRSSARAKVTTLEQRAPADCKLRSTYKYSGGTGFSFQEGSLDKSILEVASKIEIIIPTPEECKLAAEGKKEVRETMQKQSQKVVTVLSGADSGDPIVGAFSSLLTEIKTQLERLFNDMLRPIMERFNKISEFIQAISNRNLGLNIMLFNISVSTGSQISNRLKSLSNLTKRALKNEEIKEEEVDDVISGYSSPDLVFTEGGIEDTLEEEP